MDLVSTLEEGTLTKCVKCNMKVSEIVRGVCYERSAICRDLLAQRREHQSTDIAVEVLKRSFTTYGKSLTRVEVCKYLRRLLAFNNVDTQAIRGNLKKC